MSSSFTEAAQTHRSRRCYFLQTSSQISRFPLRQPQSQVSAILKMNHLKYQQKQHLARFKTSVENESDDRYADYRYSYENHLTGRKNLKEIANNNNGKFIDNNFNGLRCSQLLNIENYARTSTNANSRKNYHSCLQKCRLVTENYDQLKNQIINKIKLKRNQRMEIKIKNSGQKNQHDFIKNQGLIGLVVVENQKENYANLQRAEAMTQHKKHKIKTRYRSLSDSTKKGQRYMEMSVSQFMEQKQCDISSAISKKFEQYQKQLNQRSLPKPLQKIQRNQFKDLPQNVSSSPQPNNYHLKEQSKKKKLTITHL